MADAQQRLQGLSEDYQKFQQELQNSVQTRQRLESQQQENQGVKREFDVLKEDASIYKLVGPVLLKQDKIEAMLAVDSRLEFIENEIKRVEKQIADVEEKSDKKRAEIIQTQSEGQQSQVAGQVQTAA